MPQVPSKLLLQPASVIAVKRWSPHCTVAAALLLFKLRGALLLSGTHQCLHRGCSSIWSGAGCSDGVALASTCVKAAAAPGVKWAA